MRPHQFAQPRLAVDDEARRSGRAERRHALVKRRINVRLVEQRGDVRAATLARRDLVRMNAAEDQQVMIVREVSQGLDSGPDSLIFIEETKDADQHAVIGQPVEHGKAAARRALPDCRQFGGCEIRQRVVENVSEAVDVVDIAQVAPVMDDRGDVLVALQAAQVTGDAVGQQMRAAEFALQPRHCPHIEGQQRLRQRRQVDHPVASAACER
jgi:hypothetical protein